MHDAVPQQSLNRDTSGYQFGMHYGSSLDSILSVYYRVSKVKFPDRASPVSQFDLDNGYRDQRIGVTSQVDVTSHSRAEAQFEYLRREHDHITDRDYGGLLWRLTYDWMITAKLELETSLWRGIDQVEDVNASRVIEKGIEIKPVWSMSEKTKVSGDIASSQRNYVNYAGLAAPRKDDLITIGAQLEYTPLEKLQCIFRWERGDRNSNSDIYNFTYGTVSARIQYIF